MSVAAVCLYIYLFIEIIYCKICTSSVDNIIFIMILTQAAKVSDSVSKLKLKKACGQDNTSNEMLKLSSPYIIQALANLFNLILSSGDFPETSLRPGLKDSSLQYIKKEINLIPIITVVFVWAVT